MTCILLWSHHKVPRNVFGFKSEFSSLVERVVPEPHGWGSEPQAAGCRSARAFAPQVADVLLEFSVCTSATPACPQIVEAFCMSARLSKAVAKDLAGQDFPKACHFLHTWVDSFAVPCRRVQAPRLPLLRGR